MSFKESIPLLFTSLLGPKRLNPWPFSSLYLTTISLPFGTGELRLILKPNWLLPDSSSFKAFTDAIGRSGKTSPPSHKDKIKSLDHVEGTIVWINSFDW